MRSESGWPMIRGFFVCRHVVAGTICTLVFLSGADAKAAVAPALRCDVAAAEASERTGVPAAVLMAIARVETGRKIGGTLSAWPWTVNEGGPGSWFDTAEDAARHVASALSSGATNIDIGCFQVNWRWHGKAFASVEAMFDPVQNALYAAEFLRDLHDEYGTWEGAIGAYHSRRGDAAEGYLAKVLAVLDMPAPDRTTAPVAVAVADAEDQPRMNRYPLLQGQGAPRNGSLFAAQAGESAQPLFR